MANNTVYGEIIDNYYDTIFASQLWNGFDLHIFVAPIVFSRFVESVISNEYTIEQLFSEQLSDLLQKTVIDAIQLFGIQSSVFTYVHIMPSKLVIPVKSIYRENLTGVVTTNYVVRGQIGLNMSPLLVIEYLALLTDWLAAYNETVTLKAEYDKETYMLPTLIVLFKNDLKFRHMSAIILDEVILFGEELQAEPSSMQQQSVLKFSASNMYMIDIAGDIATQYNLLYKLLG